VICKGWTLDLCTGPEFPEGGILLFSRTSTLFATRRSARLAIQRTLKHMPDHPLGDEKETFIVRLVPESG
jgi:hypothetical protein